MKFKHRRTTLIFFSSYLYKKTWITSFELQIRNILIESTNN